MEGKRLSQWTYDKAINEVIAKYADLLHIHDKISSVVDFHHEHIAPVQSGIQQLSIHTPRTDRIDANVERMQRHLQELESEESKLETEYYLLTKAKPFIIGPATIDSLFEEPPKTQEYILEQKLPFDTMFFELTEDVRIQIPFINKEAPMKGLLFSKEAVKIQADDGSAESGGYLLAPYYFDPEHNKLRTFEILFPYIPNNTFTIINEGNKLFVDVKKKEVSVNRITDRLNNPENTEAYDHFNITDEHMGSTLKLVDFATNITNYINAQNIRFIKSKRKVAVREGPKNKTKKYVEPFYVITVQSGEKEVKGVGERWELNERIYVRGHDRKYRNENNEIYRVIWIQPFIKGPSDAPFRTSRYQFLADKLARERKIIENPELLIGKHL